MSEVTSLEGPVELLNGALVLMIPLAHGGNDFVACSRGIGQIEGDCLKVTIPQWLAEKLTIRQGSIVQVDNQDGKFNIRPVGRS
jgi:hypothetical protein